jgi:hypothetical protein
MTQQPAGWGQSPPLAQPKTDYRPWYKRGWVLFVAGLVLGGVIGSAAAGASDSDPQAAPDTSIVFQDRDRKVFTTYCEDLESATERKTCEDVQAIQRREIQELKQELESLKKKAAAAPKPQPTTPPAATIEDGIWAVPDEVEPGTYVSAGSESCCWARLRNTNGDLDSIIANSINPGRQRVTIRSTDKAFETTGCPTWQKVG